MAELRIIFQTHRRNYENLAAKQSIISQWVKKQAGIKKGSKSASPPQLRGGFSRAASTYDAEHPEQLIESLESLEEKLQSEGTDFRKGKHWTHTPATETEPESVLLDLDVMRLLIDRDTFDL